jgi:hypothetical protein
MHYSNLSDHPSDCHLANKTLFSFSFLVFLFFSRHLTLHVFFFSFSRAPHHTYTRDGRAEPSLSRRPAYTDTHKQDSLLTIKQLFIVNFLNSTHGTLIALLSRSASKSRSRLRPSGATGTGTARPRPRPPEPRPPCEMRGDPWTVE